MTVRKFLVSVAGLCALGFSSAALPDFDPVGDDTDIFLANPLLEASRPNVLFFVDNTANWNTAFETEQKALVNAVSKLVTDAFNVGLGMFPETGSPNDSIDGAYIRFGLRQMTPTNKARFLDLITGLDKGVDKGNNATFSLAMDEMFRYYAGKPSNSGVGKVKRDFFGNKDYNAYAYDLDGAPFDDEKSTTYRSPIVSGCQKNFIIVISNGPASDNSSSLAEAKKYLDGWAAATTPPSTAPAQIALTPNGEQTLWADEYAKFMSETDCSDTVDGKQNVFTYTIDVLPPTSGQGPSHTALLKSMANAGKGRYFAVNSIADTTELENILRTIFVEVQAVNSVFASVALPVSVNVRGTNLNQVYIGQFRPDKARGVRWFGNLKMYKIGQDADGNAFLVDSKGDPAENPATGFVSPTAESFWSAKSDFWNHRNNDENGAGAESDLPDGDLVEKGGAAQHIRTLHATDQSKRQVYTCTSSATSGLCKSGDALSATPFDTTNPDITAGALGTYVKKPVVSITAKDNGDGTATATATVTAHGFATGNVVKIVGATPNVYNTNPTSVITVTGANEFTYQLASVPAANVARVVANNNNLATADVVTVTGSTQAEYNVTDAPVTRIDANTFEYGMAGSNFASSTGHTIVGKKRATTVTGVNLSARAVVPNHGYGASGTVCCITIEGANEAAFNMPDPGTTITIVDANTFDYTTSTFISGTADTARVSASAHGLFTGYSVTISGSSEPLFNGAHTITRIDANTFTFTVSGAAAPATAAGMVASIGITRIEHPTTGAASGRDIATVTTSLTHAFTNGQNVVISGTGAFPGSGYDGTWAISNVAATTFTITNASVDSAPTPLTGSGMLVGRAVQRIDPVVTATGTILSGKQITPVTSVASKAVATGGNITAGRPADADLTDRDNLILWTRGRDNYENEKPNTTAPDVRPSIHGDVLHSRPAVVNYGRGSIENDVYIFYGTNDGALRAVKGGLDVVKDDNHPDGTPVQPGDERWSFIPTESFPKLDRQRTRIPAIDRNHSRDYFVDGAVSAFTQDVDGDGQLIAGKGDKVYGYFVLRRGGDSIYALDISDPGAPVFLWRKKAGDPGYEELGQTWSEAKVVRINANTRPSESPSGNPDNLAIVMGAGYDPGPEDQHPCLTDFNDTTKVRRIAVGTGVISFTTSGTCSVSGATGGSTDFFRTKGRGILVIDALDGHVIWQAGPAPTGATNNLTITDMAYAIPSDVRVVDLNGDGFADSAVVGDTGGNVWRLDLSDVEPKNWRVRKVATLAASSATAIVSKRKFMFAPEVVVAQDSLGLFLGILLGSGDREHPFDGVVQNRFYLLKDRGEAATLGSGTGTRSWSIAGNTASTGTGGTAVAGGVILDADLYDATVIAGANDSGWFRGMAPGEKIVSSALVVGGNAIFSTNQPTVLAGTAVDACASNLGVARIYTISATDASGTATVRSGGGYVPSAVFAAIQIGATGGGGSSIPSESTGGCVGAACGDQNTAGGGPPGSGPTTGIVCTGTSCWSVGNLDVNSRRRSYWYRSID